eukprot:scaffold42659_cov29-Attheya_sp.AAC.3
MYVAQHINFSFRHGTHDPFLQKGKRRSERNRLLAYRYRYPIDDRDDSTIAVLHSIQQSNRDTSCPL